MRNNSIWHKATVWIWYHHYLHFSVVNLGLDIIISNPIKLTDLQCWNRGSLTPEPRCPQAIMSPSRAFPNYLNRLFFPFCVGWYDVEQCILNFNACVDHIMIFFLNAHSVSGGFWQSLRLCVCLRSFRWCTSSCARSLFWVAQWFSILKAQQNLILSTPESWEWNTGNLTL